MTSIVRTVKKSRTGRDITSDPVTATARSATHVGWKDNEFVEGMLFALLLKQCGNYNIG